MRIVHNPVGGTILTMTKAAVVSPRRSMRGLLTSSRRLLWYALLALFVANTEAALSSVACGTTGFQNFAANGNDLRAATSCCVLGTNCASVGGSKAAVENTYGADISFWCTGLVADFSNVFKDMTVSGICRELSHRVSSCLTMQSFACHRPLIRHSIGILQMG